MASKLDQLRADDRDRRRHRRHRGRAAAEAPGLHDQSEPAPQGGRDAGLCGASSTRRSPGARRQGGAREAVVAAICDRLAVAFGAELAGIVPGRVSTEVDADLSFDTPATVAKARAIIARLRGARHRPRAHPDQDRLDLGGHPRGARCCSARASTATSRSCSRSSRRRPRAEAGAFLISPFVGRILDWHVKAGGGPYTRRDRSRRAVGPAHLRLLQGARHQDRGDGRLVPQRRARSRRSPAATASPSRRRSSTSSRRPRARCRAGSRRESTPTRRRACSLDEKSFRFLLNEDAMATEKLAEGIRAFVKDLRALRGARRAADGGEGGGLRDNRHPGRGKAAIRDRPPQKASPHVIPAGAQRRAGIVSAQGTNSSPKSRHSGFSRSISATFIHGATASASSRGRLRFRCSRTPRNRPAGRHCSAP